MSLEASRPDDGDSRFKATVAGLAATAAAASAPPFVGPWKGALLFDGSGGDSGRAGLGM